MKPINIEGLPYTSFLEDYQRAGEFLRFDNEDIVRKRTQEESSKVKDDAIATLSDQVMKLMAEVQEIKKRK